MHSLDVQPIDHFKKAAKRFLEEVRGGSETALSRFAAVYRDASAQGREIGLMRAQHIIAKENGFGSWDALVKASSIELRLAITMSKIPALNDFGIGSYDRDHELPPAEHVAKFAENRALLRGSVEQVTRTVEWLRRNIVPTKTLSDQSSSYSFKHQAAGEIGYVTNGVFIAAGVIAGYPFEIADNSPNVRFGFSIRSRRELRARAHEPSKLITRMRTLGHEILRTAGVAEVVASTCAPQVVWREGGELRGMKFSAFSTRPPLVSIDIDNFEPLIYARTMRKLGVIDPQRRTFAYFDFGRIRAQRVIVAYDEVEHAIAWAIGASSASGAHFDAEASEDDSTHGRMTWSRRARQMSNLQQRR